MSSTRNKRAYSSTTSELDTTSNETTLDQSTLQDHSHSSSLKTGKRKKKAKTASDTQRKMDQYLDKDGLQNTSSTDIAVIERKLDDINKRLSKMLTKDDSNFITEIIRNTIEGMKDKLLGSVIKRLDALECQIHDKNIETDSLKKTLEEKDEVIRGLKEENIFLKEILEIESKER